MGEKDNGYARCELRRGLRGRGVGLGGEMHRQTRYDSCTCNNRSGHSDGRNGDCGCGNNRNDGCGICNLLRGGSERYENACESKQRRNAWEQRCGSSMRDRDDRRNGCGCGCESDRPVQGACAGRECHELMNKLQQLDFSIQEVVLYLDGYPDCDQALDYYHQLLQERCAVEKEYEKSCGPLTSRSNRSTHGWDWGQSPWPWHHEFPGNKHG